MSERIKKNFALLEFLSTCGPTQMKTIITSSTPEQIKSLVELVANVQFGSISIPENHMSFIKAKKKLIRNITSKQVTYKDRKALLADNTKLLTVILKFSLDEIRKLITDG